MCIPDFQDGVLTLNKNMMRKESFRFLCQVKQSFKYSINLSSYALCKGIIYPCRAQEPKKLPVQTPGMYIRVQTITDYAI